MPPPAGLVRADLEYADLSAADLTRAFPIRLCEFSA
jgi:uncharacterized protein YjbI with pentapeptide repeats